jgi:hypothetical protein
MPSRTKCWEKPSLLARGRLCDHLGSIQGRIPDRCKRRLARSCGPGLPTLRLSFAYDDAPGNEGRKARSPGEARISCKTIAQGRPDVRPNLWLLAHIFFTNGGRGRDLHPAFPAPFNSRVLAKQGSDAMSRRETAGARPSEHQLRRDLMECISSGSAPRDSHAQTTNAMALRSGAIAPEARSAMRYRATLRRACAGAGKLNDPSR